MTSQDRTIRFEIDIDAPVDFVWSVLTDLERYPEWNPFTYRVETSRRIGEPVVMHVRLGKSERVMHEKVFAWDPPGRRIGWGLPMLGGFLLDCCRYQELHDLGDGRTRYVTYEGFEGLLSWLVVRLFGEQVRQGFEANGRALAARVNALRERGEPVSKAGTGR